MLFVAISIGPQRTIGNPAMAGAPRQHLAEATLLGDPQYAWSGWLNPLQDVSTVAEQNEPQDASA